MNRKLSVQMLLCALLLLISVTSACARSKAPEPKSDPVSPRPDQQSLQLQAELQKTIEQIAAAAKGHVGVAAVVLETNTAVSLNPQDHFPMQSVYKLPISMAVMQQVDAGKLKLEQRVPVTKNDFIGRNARSPIRDQNPKGVELTLGELIRFAIAESDGTASDVLMRVAGGPAAIQTFLTQLGITDMVVLNSEKQMVQDFQLQFKNWATPEAAVALLRALHEKRGLTESSQALLVKFMIESTPGPRRLRDFCLPALLLRTRRELLEAEMASPPPPTISALSRYPTVVTW